MLWLAHQDSNLDSWYQKPESCRWTMGQCDNASAEGESQAAHPAADMQSDKVVGREGVEPATLGLKVPCSTS